MAESKIIGLQIGNMKTAIQTAFEIYKNDAVSFTDWFIDNYEWLLELEQEHIRISYNDGKNSVLNNEIKSSIEYYNQNWNKKL